MNWKFKALVFRQLSKLTFGSDILFQLQKYGTREVPRRVEALDELLQAARKIFALYKENYQGLQTSDFAFLEIGAGRDLAVAIALRMLGIPKVYCLDVDRLARASLVEHASKYMAAALNYPVPQIKNWSDVEKFGIFYFAPSKLDDFTSLEQFTCFYSTDVLEHIPKSDLNEIIKRAAKMLPHGSLSIHGIDYSDHYARADQSLSRFNFLKFSDEQWKQYNPSLHYVNRLRHSEYVSFFKNSGFEIILDDPIIHAPEQEILMNLAPEFKSFEMDDLFARSSWIAARRGNK